MTVLRAKNGKRVLREYVVTYTVEVFESVNAVSEEEAAEKALRAATAKHTGRNPTILEVEAL